MERTIADPETREQLTPGYRLGCKRVLLSNDFYPALAAHNASLVTEKITGFTADAMITADGARHPVDTVIFATGFHVTDNPMFGRSPAAAADAGLGLGQTYLGTVRARIPRLLPADRGQHRSRPLLDDLHHREPAGVHHRRDPQDRGGRRQPGVVRPDVAAA